MSDDIERILIVEDDPDNRADLRRMLLRGSDRRYEFVEAALASIALSILQDNQGDPFDCVLLDYHLPDMDAQDVLAKLCDGNDTPPWPVVVIIGSDRNVGQNLLRAGAQDYLGKSWLTADSLTRSIDNAIERFAMMSEQRKTDQALRDSEEKFRSLLESAPDAMVIVDNQGTIVLVNVETERLFGYQRQELLGKKVEKLIPARYRHGHIAKREEFAVDPQTRVMNNGTTLFGLRKDGYEFPGEVSLSPLKTVGGTLISSSIRDVTEGNRSKLKLEESEVRYRRLFEAANDGILILDAVSQKITHVNPFMTTLLDYPSEYFIGKELWEFGFMKDKQASVTAMQQLAENGSIRYESLPLEDRQGRKHPVEMVANKYDEGAYPVIQCNIRDIAERRRLEKQMLSQAAELSDLHRRKDEFLAMLSHELRSPLAPITNAVQLLGLEKGSESPLQKQARGIIERQVGQLQHLVDDLLEVSRITTGRVQLRQERIAIRGVVEGAIETSRPLIDQRKHKLTVLLPDETLWLNADAARLEQVVVNLLTNAAKYTEVGGQIWLSVLLEGKECVLRVRDTGVGIPPALVPKIFDLFTQAERSLDRSQGGLGIGLALVQRLTELHGGNVEVHSSLGHGSEFIVRLPLIVMELKEFDLPSVDNKQCSVRPLRVLVVDDNFDTVLSFSMLLRASGHDVRTANDGIEAVKAAYDFRPDVMLLDIGLPGINGYEVAKRIRQQPIFKSLVLVALTGYGQDADRQISKQAGFDHHLVKPARLEQLQQILANASSMAFAPVL